MVKAVALYRDGSKLSQPLSASTDSGKAVEAATGVMGMAEKITERVLVRISPTPSTPESRSGYTQKAIVGDISRTCALVNMRMGRSEKSFWICTRKGRRSEAS